MFEQCTLGGHWCNLPKKLTFLQRNSLIFKLWLGPHHSQALHILFLLFFLAQLEIIKCILLRNSLVMRTDGLLMTRGQRSCLLGRNIIVYGKSQLEIFVGEWTINKFSLSLVVKTGHRKYEDLGQVSEVLVLIGRRFPLGHLIILGRWSSLKVKNLFSWSD